MQFAWDDPPVVNCRAGKSYPAADHLINLVSDNVGGVKLFSSTLQHALKEERHFALAEKVPFQSKARIGPTHPSLRSQLRSRESAQMRAGLDHPA
jgi:hypothetical protein